MNLIALAAGNLSASLENSTVITVGMIAAAAAAVKWATDIWANVRPQKPLEERVAKALAEIQDKAEQRTERCEAKCAANLMQSEQRTNEKIGGLADWIKQLQADRKESVGKLHDKIDGVSRDVRAEMSSMREMLGKQFGELISATQRVTNDYSLLIGELRGEMEARREREKGALR